jgi:hypothetical protein
MLLIFDSNVKSVFFYVSETGTNAMTSKFEIFFNICLQLDSQIVQGCDQRTTYKEPEDNLLPRQGYTLAQTT